MNKNNMKLLSIGILVLTTVFSCHKYDNSEINKQNYLKRKSEPSYTILIKHEACTECLDAYIVKGQILVPPDLKNLFGDSLNKKDIILTGNFPLDMINSNSFFYNPDYSFQVTGKLIGIDSTNLTWSKAPIFYVEKWKRG